MSRSLQEFREFFDSFRKRGGMYVWPHDTTCVMTFLQGYDYGAASCPGADRSGTPLAGLDEFLSLRVYRNGHGFHDNVGWPGLAMAVVNDEEHTLPFPGKIGIRNDERERNALLLLVEEFLVYREKNGLEHLLREHFQAFCGCMSEFEEPLGKIFLRDYKRMKKDRFPGCPIWDEPAEG
jgi:hypothetical protein